MPFISPGGGGGSGATPTLSQVLVAGNSAGASTVNMNSNKVTSLANGTTGTDASAFSQADRWRVKNLALGLKGQVWDIETAALGSATLTSQRVVGGLIGLIAGDVVTNIIMSVAVAASGTAPTGLFVGIYDSSSNLVASSNNLNSNAIWTSTGFAVAPLSATYTVTTTGGYYLAVLQNGAFGTTPLQTNRNSNIGSTASLASPSGLFASFLQSGQATLPNPATPASSGTDKPWFGWN